MVAIFIAFFVIVLSFNFFMISYQINGINRLVLGAPMSLFETAIVFYDLPDNTSPYFDKSLLKENIEEYFAFHMPRYSNDYSLTYYYYNIANHSLDMSAKAKAVEITIDTVINLSYNYQKTMFYEIRSN